MHFKNMLAILFSLLLLQSAVVLTEESGEDYHEDNLVAISNEKEVLKSVPRLPEPLVKCLVSFDVYCSSKDAEVKKLMKQVVSNSCANCNDAQRDQGGRVLLSMLVHHSDAWKHFVGTYNKN